MNERIKELLEQAMVLVPASEGSFSYWHFDKEKFAESIVRESALFVFKQNGPKSALNLLKHFGIE